MFDLIIRGGAVYDGTGRPARWADVAVSGGKIAAVEPLPQAQAARVIDARGKWVTPGFIDIHRHADAAAFRRDNLGFVFQEFNLLDTFTLRDNIYLPLVLAGRPYRELKARLDPIARQLGILELLDKYPYEVSGGQKQRAAVARALITHPRLILADEPTGALDSRSTDELLDLFGQINRQGQTILMVTHSVKSASHAGRVLFIKDGQVFHQLYRGQCTDEQLYQKIADTLTMLQAGGDRA